MEIIESYGLFSFSISDFNDERFMNGNQKAEKQHQHI